MTDSSGGVPAAEPIVEGAQVAAITAGRHGDPFSVLGMHGGGAAPLTVRVFAPHAEAVAVIETSSGKRVAELERIDDAGFFAGVVSGRKQSFDYLLEFSAGSSRRREHDPYRFSSLLGDLDIHLMGEGRHRRLYQVLGAHPETVNGVDGVRFAVWAPNAQRVSVVGDFNDWHAARHPMRKRIEVGVWELFVPGVERGARYKYSILGCAGDLLPLKSDPLSFVQEAPPATASVVHGLTEHDWRDEQWMRRRGDRQALSAPMSIYEVHLGSWRRAGNGDLLDYDAIGDSLVSYVKELGFTHVELLPISEHPFTGSWGYQPIGLFAPTSRFGSPEMFARLVDRLHQAGIGVVVDWVPAHFPSDEHGLARFDGTALYEHQDPRLGIHKDWDTLIYNFGRAEVGNFLASNAYFWLDRYHVDALRVDAVASMLYLDYSREPGEWLPNKFGGNENLEVIDFLRETNTHVFGDFPGVTTIAEESTAYPRVSRPVDSGGLGFGYKWNMGWMHDTLQYMSEDPIHRRHHHGKMTFGLHYAFSESFVLPLSHDEVVHGKRSIVGRMPGDRWQRFANLRAYYAFMWTHPGKKLLFMGSEFAQEREWNHDRALDWELVDDPLHAGVQRLVADLNRLYRSAPPLHEFDCDPAGFEWIDEKDSNNSVISYIRRGRNAADPVVVVCNFTPAVRERYRIGVPCAGLWAEVLNSDSHLYGGSDVGNGGRLTATETPCHGRSASLELTLPPLATLVLRRANENRGTSQ